MKLETREQNVLEFESLQSGAEGNIKQKDGLFSGSQDRGIHFMV